MHNASDHYLFFNREVTAVAVGDAFEPVHDPTQVIFGPDAPFQLLEVVGDLA
jgi:hypothetical protein